MMGAVLICVLVVTVVLVSILLYSICKQKKMIATDPTITLKSVEPAVMSNLKSLVTSNGNRAKKYLALAKESKEAGQEIRSKIYLGNHLECLLIKEKAEHRIKLAQIYMDTPTICPNKTEEEWINWGKVASIKSTLPDRDPSVIQSKFLEL